MTIEENYQNKNMILIGKSRECADFYIEFQKLLNITEIRVTDSDGDLRMQLEKYPVKIFHFIEQRLDRKKVFPVICGWQENQRLDDYFYSEGMFWGEDYIDSLYIRLAFTRMLMKQMVGKKIWIYGAGNNGRVFYESFTDKLLIDGFISSFEREHEYMGLPVIRPSEIKQLQNAFVVICSDAKKDMEEQLEKMKYEIMTDYCFQGQLCKKMFVGLGICQIGSVLKALKKNQCFVRKFFWLIFGESRYNESGNADKKRINAYGKFCDVIFYASDYYGNYYKGIIERFYVHARHIYQPSYYFLGQHMQMTDYTGEFCVRHLNTNKASWFRGDREVDKLINEGYKPDEILSMISNDNYWAKEEIIENWNRQIKKVEVLDRISSLKMADFIKKNYKKIPIFKEGTHFGKELTIELANQLAEMIEVQPFSEEEKQQVLESFSEDDRNVMPIYPCVAKALELSFVRADSKYIFSSMNEEVEYLDFKDYEMKYIQYAYAIKKAMKDYSTMFR